MIDNPSIMCGDDSIDLEATIVNICGLDLQRYINDDSILTRDLIHGFFDEILDTMESWSDNRVYKNIAYQVLGKFILKTGSKLPEDLKETIINSATWEIDKNLNWPSNWINLRKFYLNDLRVKIENHIYGEKTHLVDLIIMDDSEFKNLSVGVKQTLEIIKKNKSLLIKNLNLDSCHLYYLPDFVFNLKSLKILSVNGNQLTRIPEKISNFKLLEEFHAEHNYIREVPESLSQLENLKILNLAHNELTSIPTSLKELKFSLEALYLQNNSINTLPDSFLREFKNKCIINLNNNLAQKN